MRRARRLRRLSPSERASARLVPCLTRDLPGGTSVDSKSQRSAAKRRTQTEHIASSESCARSSQLVWGQRSLFAASAFDSAIVIAGIMHSGETTMVKSAALLMLVVLTASNAAIAKPHHGHRQVARTVHHAKTVHHANASSARESHSGITCEMVRAYVAQVGLAQATAMAQSAGITPAEKERAKRCLAEKS